MRQLMTGMLIGAGLMALAPQGASAQGLCERLWVERNTIYKQNGYCFNTPRGVRYFGNAGCQYDDVRQVPLSSYEQQRIAQIVAQEREMGCGR
jgi:hypothetical protein